MSNLDLWTCPHCGRQFTNRNQSHSCARYTVESRLESTSPQVASLYAHFVELVNNCGEVIIEATKTSITFKSPGLFAVVHFQKMGLQVSFWLPRRIENSRILRIYANSAQEYAHHLKLDSLEDFDEQLQNWLCEAYAVGMG